MIYLITIAAPLLDAAVQQFSKLFMERKSMITFQRRALAVLSLFFICCAVARAAPRCAEMVATVVSLQGTVDVRGKESEQWAPVSAAAEICAGDSVTVRRYSRAVLRLEREQTNVQLGEGSTLTFPGGKDQHFSVVELLKGVGHFISRVPHALKIKTPFVNAAVEGTEFVVKVEDAQALVSVSEGHVLADNASGQLILQSGQSALTTQGAAPGVYVVADPMQTVQWALYYPQVFEFDPQDVTAFGPESARAVIADSMRALRANDPRTALTLLEQAGDGITDTNYLLYRAHLLLMVGRIAEAQAGIEQVLVVDHESSGAWVMRSVIAVTQGRAPLALESAQQAVTTDANSAAAQLALSYAYQAQFDLDAALNAAVTATGKNENNALAWARVAELQLMHGRLDATRRAAQRAVQINPNSAQAKTVLGFALLLDLQIEPAAAAFEDAVLYDPAAPLPRLGLGLVKIRQGDLVGGRAQIEIATSLDPRASSLRSYVGKAYYSEQRHALAAQQFNFAKELDPNDPTPWFYHALLLQTQNQPGAALGEMQKSIALNDHRAVYRSRVLLDSDLAARNASQAVIYQDLGLDQVALETAYASVSADPGNFAAHRFLADAYGALPRSEIARVSEVLQSQLLQPLSAAPLSAQLAEGNATMSAYAGASALPGYNEYSSLFLQPRPKFHVLGLLGNQNTRGGDVAASAEFNQVSLSAGAYRFDTDGYRDNADLSHEVKYAFLQAALTPSLNAQVEARDSALDHGDVVLRFGEDNFRPNFRETVDSNSVRVGVHAAFGPADDLLLSWIRNENDMFQTDLMVFPDDPISFRDVLPSSGSGDQREVQYLHHGAASKLIIGGGQVHIKVHDIISFDMLDGGNVISSEVVEDSRDSIRHNNLYVYLPMELSNAFQLTAGASAERYDSRYGDLKQFNPKLGMIWRPSPATTLRAAYMRGLKRPILNNQTLEPTQVAGFNQFFDDTDATDARRYGFGGSHRVSNAWFTGFEAVRRNTTRYVFSNGNAAQGETQTEISGRAYVAWLPLTQLAVNLSYHEAHFERSASGTGSLLKPAEVTTRNLPVALNFNHASGVFAQWTTTGVEQEISFVDDTTSIQDDARFVISDLALGYRFAARKGSVSFAAKNVFDKKFQYQSANSVDTSLLPNNPYQPRRTLVGNVSYNF